MKRFMQKLHKHKELIAIIVVLVIGFLSNSLSLERGNQNYERKTAKSKHQELNQEGLEQIQGQIISHGQLQKTREQVLSKPTQTFRGEVYNFTNKNIKKALKKQLDQGTKTQIILENQQYKQHKNTFKQLQNEFKNEPHFELKNDRQMGSEYVHAKFFLTDEKAIIQTANLTRGGLNNSIEHMFITSHTGIYQSLETIFNKDREGQKIHQKDIHPNILICPINCRSSIASLIKNAKHSIDIATQYIVDPSIIKLLKESEEKTIIGETGEESEIKLQLLTSDNNGNKDLKYHLPTEIHRTYKKNYLHTKTMLIDDRILMLGSINFSANSMDNNREIAILITDPTLIQQYKKEFNTLRKNAE